MISLSHAMTAKFGSVCLLLASAAALPDRPWQELAKLVSQDEIPASLTSVPNKKYNLTQNVHPRIQWGDAGGYCGSMAIQQISLGKGVWISQQAVRDATVPGGGNDNEILETNIELALNNLALQWGHFDYKTEPAPQADGYRAWIKQELVAGNGIAWMIMLQGGQYPVYPTLPYGFYSHVEPVYGIFSDHPLDDGQWYDDDVILHSTDADEFDYYRTMDSLPADITQNNVSECGSLYLGYPCIYEQYGFGWSVQGVVDPQAGDRAVPVSLTVDSSTEPDTRAGKSPTMLHGTVWAAELTVGAEYEIYRFDSTSGVTVDLDYSIAKPIETFTARSTEHSFGDETGIPSDGTTYYRVLMVE